MTIISIDPQLIDPNPYQPRQDMDGEPLQRLAEDIAEHGLLQKPAARPHPEHAGRYQLAFGHRRLAAWQIAFPGQPIEVDVTPMDDKQMFTAAIVENEDREALSAIEKAKAMQSYITTFNVTQLEAGKLFGLTSQGAVSNLLRLLKLPAPIQTLVTDGELPERFARQVLPLAQVRPEEATKIAKVIAKAPEDEREDAAKSQMWTMLRGKNVKSLHSAPWGDLGWPGKPIATNSEVVPEVIACKGCPFNLRVEDRDNCLRVACFDLKTFAWADHEAQRIAKKLGISPIGIGEQPKIIYSGEQNSTRPQKALANVKTNPAIPVLLRIVPYTGESNYSTEYRRRNTLGSAWVALATTDEKALDKALAGIKGPVEPKPSTNSYEARYKAEQKKKADQAKENRRLIDAALPHLLPKFSIDPVFLDLMWTYEFVQRSDWEKMKAADKPQALLRGMLINRYSGNTYNPSTPASVVKKLEGISTEMKVKLPKNWSAAVAETKPKAKPTAKPAESAKKKTTKK